MLSVLVIMAGIAATGLGLGVWRGRSFARVAAPIAIVGALTMLGAIILYPSPLTQPLLAAGVASALFASGLSGPALFKFPATAVVFSVTSALLVGSLGVFIGLMASGL